MKTWVKVIIIILAVMVVVMAALVVYGIYTYKQVKEVVMLTQDTSIQRNFEALMSGDCAKLPTVEAQLLDVKTKIYALCSNFGVKFAAGQGWVSAEQYATCKELNNTEGQMYQALSEIKAACANKTVIR